MPFRQGNEPGQGQQAQTFRGQQPLKPDQWLGFMQGVNSPAHNLGVWGGMALDALHVPQSWRPALATMGAGALNLPPDYYTRQDPANAGYARQRAQQGYRPGTTGKVGGSILVTAPLSAVLGPGAAGAFGGALTTDKPKDAKAVALGAALGFAGGKVGEKVAGAASKLLAPKLAPAVQTLADEGVQLTPGQLMGGTARTVEDASTHLPVLGTLVKNAQRQSVESFNRAAINSSLAPIGEELPSHLSAGREAIDYAAEKLGDAFEKVKPSAPVAIDGQFGADLAQTAKAAQILPQTRQDQLASILKNYVGDRFASGQIAPETIQLTDRELGTLSRQFGKSLDPDQQVIGNVLGDVQESLRNLVSRQDPAYADAISAAREGWANFVRVRNAASYVGAKEGVFSPGQFAQAVRSADSSVAKGAYARGQALAQGLSDAGQKVLPSTVPDSGTAVRGLWDMAALGAMGMGGHAMHINPIAAAPVAAMAGAYTQPGLAASRYLLSGARPAWAAPVAGAIDQYGQPVLSAASARLAQALGQGVVAPGGQ